MRVRSAVLSLAFLLLAAPDAAVAEDELYDESGRLVSSTDGDGVTSYYVYNEDGELIMTRRSDGTVVLHDPPIPPEDQ